MVQHHGSDSTEVIWHFHNIQALVIFSLHPEKKKSLKVRSHFIAIQ